MLKIAKKWPNFALSGQLWLQSDFFRKSPHPTSSPSGTDGHRKFWVPPIKNLEKKPGCALYSVWMLYKTTGKDNLLPPFNFKLHIFCHKHLLLRVTFTYKFNTCALLLGLSRPLSSSSVGGCAGSCWQITKTKSSLIRLYWQYTSGTE